MFLDLTLSSVRTGTAIPLTRTEPSSIMVLFSISAPSHDAQPIALPPTFNKVLPLITTSLKYSSDLYPGSTLIP